MPIPSPIKLRRPLLEYLAQDKNYHSLYDCVDYLSKKFKLTDEEREQKFGGKFPRKIFHKRVIDVVSEFRITKLIEDETKPGDASFRIAKSGLKLLESSEDDITSKILKKFGDYSLIDEGELNEKTESDEESLEESLDDLSKKHAKIVQLDLLQQIKTKCTPTGFEKLCLKLLVKMGYGESQHTGKTGDRGVDGIISEDALGLRQIYVQTKRIENNVPYDEVAKFFGKCAMDKVPGIFITTSDFSKNTIDEMDKKPIKLISGVQLAQYLYDYDLGVELSEKYELKKVHLEDLDEFFR